MEKVQKTSQSKGKRTNPSSWVTIEGKPGTELKGAMDYFRSKGIDLNASISGEILKDYHAEVKKAVPGKSTPPKDTK